MLCISFLSCIAGWFSWRSTSWVKVNSSIVELLLSYHNDGSLNGTVYFAQTTPSLHSSNQPANWSRKGKHIHRKLISEMSTYAETTVAALPTLLPARARPHPCPAHSSLHAEGCGGGDRSHSLRQYGQGTYGQGTVPP